MKDLTPYCYTNQLDPVMYNDYSVEAGICSQTLISGPMLGNTYMEIFDSDSNTDCIYERSLRDMLLAHLSDDRRRIIMPSDVPELTFSVGFANAHATSNDLLELTMLLLLDENLQFP